MNVGAIESGTVLQPDWDERPIRVLIADEVEVLYDVWWPHTQGWGLAMLDKKASYYRVRTSLVLTRAKVVRTEPLSELEQKVHRPDLPLRFCRSRGIRWEDLWKAEAKGVDRNENKVAVSLDEPVGAHELFIVPFGPHGGERRGVQISSGCERGMTALEILWKAAQIQATQATSHPEGVGIYRLGIQRRTPSYYLWGPEDRAGFVRE